MGVPYLNYPISNLGPMRDVGVFEFRPQHEKNCAELLIFNNIDRL
jgi:hypothetical protein